MCQCMGPVYHFMWSLNFRTKDPRECEQSCDVLSSNPLYDQKIKSSRPFHEHGLFLCRYWQHLKSEFEHRKISEKPQNPKHSKYGLYGILIVMDIF